MKRDGEICDDFLERVTSTDEPIEAGAWSDDEVEQAKESIRDFRKNW